MMNSLVNENPSGSERATQRYFIELAFNGSAYHGWQVQKNAVSVQEVLNKALSILLRQDVETVGCGRTDTGVHAKQLYVHLDVAVELDIMGAKWQHSLNSLLPKDIVAKRIIPVASQAHARFDATKRSYEYHIHQEKNPFLEGFSWLLPEQLDLEQMNQAGQILLGRQDFSCFSKSHTQTHTNICTISRAKWVRTAMGLVFHVSADRFLRNMVRAIVGTLIRVGYREIQPTALYQILESKNRAHAGTSVPACGLYLSEVIYPYLE